MDHENRVLISVSGRKLVGFGLFFAISIFTVVTYLIALYAFIAPSVDFPLDIVNVGIYDADGNASTSFSRNDIVTINVTVEMATHYYFNLPSSDNYSFNADVSYRVIIAIRDKNNQPVDDCKYFSKTISVGQQQETSFSYQVKNNPIKGLCTVEVMAWVDTGEPLTPSREDVTFNVS